MIFIDARPSEPTGALLLAECQECRGPAAVRDHYVGTIRCAQCWSNRWGTDPMRPIVPVGQPQERRYAGGRLPSPTLVPIVGARPAAASVAGAPAYRVLVAARPARGAEIPFGAQRLAHRLSAAGKRVALTYALAEELATGNLVHSCALRVDNGLGYAIWINGQAKGCSWRPALRSKISEAEFIALATGQPWTPPPRPLPPARFPCPRCMQTVRWTKAGQPYAHKREVERGEGGEPVKVPCVP